MLNLVKFGIASLVSLRKKQPFEVVFLLYCKGDGGLNGALLAALKESASTRRGKAEAKELPSACSC